MTTARSLRSVSCTTAVVRRARSSPCASAWVSASSSSKLGTRLRMRAAGVTALYAPDAFYLAPGDSIARGDVGRHFAWLSSFEPGQGPVIEFEIVVVVNPSSPREAASKS